MASSRHHRGEDARADISDRDRDVLHRLSPDERPQLEEVRAYLALLPDRPDSFRSWLGRVVEEFITACEQAALDAHEGVIRLHWDESDAEWFLHTVRR